MGWWKRRSRELRTVGLEIISPYALPFKLSISTTWAMVRHPMKFGQFVNDDLGGLTGGLAYLAQAVLIFLVVIAVTFRWLVTMNPEVPDFPFVEVVLVGAFVVMLLMGWLAFAPFFRVISGKELNVYSFVAANSYWIGLLITFFSFVFLLVGATVGFFCGFGDGVYSHCHDLTAHVGFQWPGWNDLTLGPGMILVWWKGERIVSGNVLVTVRRGCGAALVGRGAARWGSGARCLASA